MNDEQLQHARHRAAQLLEELRSKGEQFSDELIKLAELLTKAPPNQTNRTDPPN